MKKTYYLMLIASITLVLSGSVQAAGVVEVTGLQGKATDWRTPDTVMGNTTQLMTRSAALDDSKKSWLQFDLSSVYAQNSSIQGALLDAKLTFHGAKSESGTKSYVVSGLHDDAGLEDWFASELTWNNGPGNDPNHSTALNTFLTTNLYTATIPVPVLDVISETPEENRAALTAFLNTDTDGKVTFIFTAGGTCYLWNVGQPLEPVLTLTYELGLNVEKAHDPVPADDAVEGTNLAELSWINPDPNLAGDPITCTVYFGTDPNRLLMNSKTLGEDEESVGLENFPDFYPLTDETTYYWIVDCDDPVKGLIEGELWTLFVSTNKAPVVSAGDDQATWLDPNEVTIVLAGIVSDDGLPEDPGELTIEWTQTAGPETAEILSASTPSTSVNFIERGDYEFTLTADDGGLQTSDTVRVVVGDDSCDASHIETGDAYNPADFNEDCIVDLEDLQSFILNDWLTCTNLLTGC